MAANSRTFRLRIWRRVAAAFIIAIAAFTIWALSKGYVDFSRQLIGMEDIKLSDSRSEVMYRLGSPTVVIGAPQALVGDGNVVVVRRFREVLEVDGKPSDLNSMPINTPINSYQYWSYAIDQIGTTLIFSFDKADQVELIKCTDPSNNPFSCPPIANVRIGAREEDVLRLGKPTKISVDGVIKTIDYADIGVRYYLSKGTAYSFSLMRPTGGRGAVLKRYLNTLLR